MSALLDFNRRRAFETMERLKPGEFCFPLRAQDLLFSPTLLFYADRLEERGGSHRHVQHVREVAIAARRFQMLHGSKLPDLRSAELHELFPELKL